MNTKDAAAHYGSKTALAEALGISRAAVSLWGDTVPEARQYQLEILTKGKLKADRRQGSPDRRKSVV
jgi:transcriptional repressor of cell division inhibition gene dicB